MVTCTTQPSAVCTVFPKWRQPHFQQTPCLMQVPLLQRPVQINCFKSTQNSQFPVFSQHRSHFESKSNQSSPFIFCLFSNSIVSTLLPTFPSRFGLPLDGIERQPSSQLKYCLLTPVCLRGTDDIRTLFELSSEDIEIPAYGVPA